MNIFDRIKYFFSSSEYYSVEDDAFEKSSLKFKKLDDEIILNITNYIKENLFEAPKIAAKNLKLKNAVEFENVTDLMIFIIKNLEFDYEEMTQEKWKFEYFMNSYFLDKNTVCVYNKFTSSETEIGNMICSIISIRKFNGKYYCWTHIDD